MFSALAAAAVTLRFYVRMRVTRGTIGHHDWLMLASFFLTLGMGVMLIVGKPNPIYQIISVSYMLIHLDVSPTGGALHALASPTLQGLEPNGYFWVTNEAEIITEKVSREDKIYLCM